MIPALKLMLAAEPEHQPARTNGLQALDASTFGQEKTR
jgi:hypothetical protein